MDHKQTTSVVHVCGAKTKNIVTPVQNLYGLKIHDISCGRYYIFAYDEKMVYDVVGSVDSESCVVYQTLKFKMLRSGKYHSLALTPEGNLYSWGLGSLGELGLGSKVTSASDLTLISVNLPITDISCGDFHSCAIDSKGNMYSWGQNFDKQLGLYVKESKALPRNCVVEQLTLIPKFVPYFLGQVVTQVSCGSKFTVAITKVRWTKQIHNFI